MLRIVVFCAGLIALPAWANAAGPCNASSIQNCTQAIEESSDKGELAESYKWRGHAYFTKREYDLAIADFSKAIEIDPAHLPAYYWRAQSYRDKGDYERALADVSEATDIEPNYGVAYEVGGSIYFLKGEHDRAIAEYTRALTLDPESSEAYCGRARAYAKKGDKGRADADYEAAEKWNMTGEGCAK